MTRSRGPTPAELRALVAWRATMPLVIDAGAPGARPNLVQVGALPLVPAAVLGRRWMFSDAAAGRTFAWRKPDGSLGIPLEV